MTKFLHSRGLLVVLAMFAAAGVALSIATVVVGGIGWDAVFEVNAMSLFAGIDGSLSLDEIRELVPEQDVARGMWIYFLAVFVSLASAGASALNPGTPETFLLLGIVSAVVNASAFAFASVVVGVATRSRFAGIASFALLFSTPLWVGLVGVAYRDAAIASGLTLVASGVALVLLGLDSRHRTSLAFLAILLGTVLAVGSRAGAVALVGAVIVVGLLPLLLPRVRRGWSLIKEVATVGIAACLGVGASVALSPVARLDPMDWLVQSILLSRDNPTSMLVKVLAQDVMSDQLPIWYIPVYVAAQLPVATLFALTIALLGLITTVSRRLRSAHFVSATGHKRSLLIVWPFVVQGLVLPLLVTASGSNIYDGLRHVLFVVPPLMVLIGLGIVFAPNNWWRGFLTFMTLLAVVLGTWATVRWFPYSYAHVNPVAGAVKEPRIWELDYWGLSAREGVTRLRNAGLDPVFVSPTANTSLPWGATEPFDSPIDRPKGQYGWFVFERWAADMPAQCEEIFEIRRDGHLLGRGGVCAE